MVDLTKTLTEMAQKNALDPRQINSDLIDMEFTDAVSGEPDLLVLFSPTVELKGYPPWQLRLTEILYVPSFHVLRIGFTYPVWNANLIANQP